uniref:four helix bundle protein n=1 Tax=Legionella sp. W05-934-2 TaxID=1198649 RepID=UPI0034619971
SYFDFEKLNVYQASIEVVVFIDKITSAFPRRRAYLTDQLQRAGTSISLNIAEGSGEFSTNEKSRFYRMAKRSATENRSDIGGIQTFKHYKGRILSLNQRFTNSNCYDVD